MSADWAITTAALVAAVVSMRIAGWFLIGRDPPYLLRRVLEVLPGNLLVALAVLALVRHGWVGAVAAAAAALATRLVRNELAGLVAGGGSFLLLRWLAAG